jgi:hypothetical protein
MGSSEQGPDGSPEEGHVWLGCLRRYADNAAGDHDLASIRASIARGRGNGPRLVRSSLPGLPPGGEALSRSH